MAIEANKFQRVAEEIIYPKEPGIVSVSRSDIDDLIELSEGTVRKRIRICAHPTPADKLHEMLIVHKFKTYVRPHRHIGRSESFHIIFGRADVVIFDEMGSIREIIEMGDFQSGHTFYYRLNASLYHTLLIRSDHVVFQETTSGPFDPELSKAAPWAPPPDEEKSASDYLESLERNVAEFLLVQ